MTVSVLKYNNKIIAQNKNALTLTEVDWIPPMIPGCILWLDASKGITLSNNYVSNWADQSGKGNNAVQNVGGKQPLYVSNVINNQPILRFDTSDFMSFPYLSNIRTCFFVIKHRTGSQGSAPLLGHASYYDFHGGTAFPSDAVLIFNGTYSSAYIRNGQGYINGVYNAPYPMLKPTTYKILTFITTGNVRAQYITNDRNQSGRCWDGDYAEIILYNVPITSADRIQVENYLNAKYQIY